MTDTSQAAPPSPVAALVQFVRRRPWTLLVSLVALIIIQVGILFVGFEIGSRKLPSYWLMKGWDEALEAAFFPPGPPGPLKPATYTTGLLSLTSDVRPANLETRVGPKGQTLRFMGGGLTSFGDDVLILPFTGKILAARPGEDIRPTGITAPDNHQAEFLAAAKDPKFADYKFDLVLLRYNDLKYFDTDAGRGLLASYTDFDAEKVCYTNVIARLDLPKTVASIEGVKAEPGDWVEVFRSQPCLPFKHRNNSLEGQMAGGRMVLTGASTIAITMGDFHFDGMLSDEPSIAQNPNVDYGKVLSVDFIAKTHRIVSTGHRNAQGIALTAAGDLYIAEHGPRGGDELNRIIEGANYGWPIVSYGTTYTRSKLPESTSFGRHDLFEPPAFAWMPSPALSGLIAVKPGFNDAWDGDLLAASMVEQGIIRIRLQGRQPIYSELIPLGARIRYVHQHTNGQIVVWTENNELVWLTAKSLASIDQSVKDYIAGAKLDARVAHGAESAIARCSECHSFDVGDSARAPSLARIFGDKIAATSFPGYSAALRQKSGSWTKENLEAFLAAPEQFAPGTTMPSVTDGDAGVVAAIADFLKYYDDHS